MSARANSSPRAYDSAPASSRQGTETTPPPTPRGVGGPPTGSGPPTGTYRPPSAIEEERPSQVEEPPKRQRPSHESSDEEEEEYDEEDAFLTESQSSRRDKYAKNLVAQSYLRAKCMAILLALALFLALLTARLELKETLTWPVYIDFIPLFLLPVLLFLAVLDFAATRIDPAAVWKQTTVTSTGFLVAVAMLLEMSFLCLKIREDIDWHWTTVLVPFWCCVFISQLFLCFLVPGLLLTKRLAQCYEIFSMIWLITATVLLTCLKLDEELPSLAWRVVFLPLIVVILIQMAVVPNMGWLNRICLGVAILCFVLLGVRLDYPDFFSTPPWGLIFIPMIAVSLLTTAEVFTGTPESL